MVCYNIFYTKKVELKNEDFLPISDRYFFFEKFITETRLYDYSHMMFLHLYFIAINHKLPNVLYSILCRIHTRKFSNWKMKRYLANKSNVYYHLVNYRIFLSHFAVNYSGNRIFEFGLTLNFSFLQA